MPEFVRYSLEQVADALNRFCPGADVAGRAETYILHDQSLMAERDVLANAKLLLRLNSRRIVRVELPFSARLITIKHHARVFGLNGDESTTAKIALTPPSAGESFFREVKTRRIAAASVRDSMIGVPRLHRQDPARGWIMEEYVKGSPATFEDVVQLVSSAHLLYRATVRVRALARSAHNQKIIERLREMLRRLAPRLAPIPYDAVWLTVLAHGDLLAHNLIHGADGRVWIVDWEKAGINPLGFELGRLYLRYPQLKERLLALIEELTVHRGVLSPLGQLALGAAFALKWRDFMRQTVVGEAVKMFGNNPATAAAEYDLGTMAARKAVAALAD